MAKKVAELGVNSSSSVTYPYICGILMFPDPFPWYNETLLCFLEIPRALITDTSGSVFKIYDLGHLQCFKCKYTCKTIRICQDVLSLNQVVLSRQLLLAHPGLPPVLIAMIDIDFQLLLCIWGGWTGAGEHMLQSMMLAIFFKLPSLSFLHVTLKWRIVPFLFMEVKFYSLDYHGQSTLLK